MLYRKMSFSLAVAVSFFGAISAVRSAQAAETTGLYDHPVVAPLSLINGEYDGQMTSATCAPLRVKLLAKRAKLKTSKQWSEVSKSEAYKAFEDSHKDLKSANCSATVTGQDQSNCQAKTDKVAQQANALSETTQWKKLTSSKPWHGLFEDFSKAQKEGCFKPAPEVTGVK